MNPTVYIFGAQRENSTLKHIQFPSDYTSALFQNFIDKTEGGTLLAISFNNSLAYHIYCKYTLNGYFGFCVLLNGKWIPNPSKLIPIFEESYVDAITVGRILSINGEGQVQCNALKISQDEQEAVRILERLQCTIDALSPFTEQLPVIDVSVDQNVIFKLKNQATENDWHYYAGKYRSLYSIYGNIKSNLSQLLDRFHEVIQECENYRQRCYYFQKELERVNKQKKQYKFVIVLFVAMVVGAVIFIAAIDNKNTKIRHQLSTIQNNEETISSHENTIARLNCKVRKLESEYDSLESDYSSIASTYPIKITSIEIGNTYYDGSIETDYGSSLYSYRTMYLKPKISYYGYLSGSYELNIKWYKPSGEISSGTSSPMGYSQRELVYVHTGANDLILNGWGNSSKGHWGSGTYRIELWYGNVCLKSHTFTIY